MMKKLDFKPAHTVFSYFNTIAADFGLRARHFGKNSASSNLCSPVGKLECGCRASRQFDGAESGGCVETNVSASHCKSPLDRRKLVS
jgi:hypothetical protein